MSATSADETLPVEGDESALAPGPEQPVEVEVDLADAGTAIGPVHVRDADVEVAGDMAADAADAEPGEPVPAEGTQVESLQAASSTTGLALSINGETYLFGAQMAATLKQIADKAIAAVVL